MVELKTTTQGQIDQGHYRVNQGNSKRYGYIVINHRTGQRFEPVIVDDGIMTDEVPVPIDARVQVYSATTAEIFWRIPSGVEPIATVVSRNGVDIGIRTGNSFMDEGRESNQDYIYALRFILSNGIESTAVEVTTINATNDYTSRFAFAFQGDRWYVNSVSRPGQGWGLFPDTWIEFQPATEIIDSTLHGTFAGVTACFGVFDYIVEADRLRWTKRDTSPVDCSAEGLFDWDRQWAEAIRLMQLILGNGEVILHGDREYFQLRTTDDQWSLNLIPGFQ